MGSFLNITIAAVLALFFTLGINIFFSAEQEYLYDSRIVLNTVCNYIDVVTDSGRLTKNDYVDFLNTLHTTKRSYDIVLIREKKLVFNENGVINTSYIPSEQYDNNNPIENELKLNNGDKFIVKVEPTSISYSERILKKVFLSSISKISVTMSGVVRNG